jgi:fumarate reductase flavoprotein subunit
MFALGGQLVNPSVGAADDRLFRAVGAIRFAVVDDLQADVIVIGSGAAGLIAAIEAHDAGAEVLVLESEAELGGSTRLSGGYTALCETEMQPGTREELYADLVESHHFDADEALTRLYVDNAASLYDRLLEFGLTFAGLETFAHMSKP